MVDNSFFDEQTDQSLVKARIVEKYFWAWAKVISSSIRKFNSSPRIAYIDLFSGPGRYKNGKKSTPIKVLESAIADPDMQSMLVTIFNDADHENVSSLQKAIQLIPGVEKLRHSPVVYNNEVGDNIVKLFDNNKLVPTLFFVDPWGYKGLSLQLINSVVKNWGCDCIFFFNYNRINMGLGNEMVRQHMDALFGQVMAEQLRQKLSALDSKRRELAIVEAISEALQGMGGKYVLPFRFKDENGSRTKHHLFFVSKHVRGYEIMKDIMAKESSENTQGVPSFEYNIATTQQPLLFELSRPLDELEDLLLKEFSGRRLSMIEIYDQHHVGKRYIKKNYKTALRKLEERGIISVSPMSGRKRKKGTFADHLIVSFPATQ